MFEDFSIYDDCEPLGVELPKTSVSETVLKSIDLDKKSSTKEIMYELARKGLRDKGITNFSNKKEYFDHLIDSFINKSNPSLKLKTYSHNIDNPEIFITPIKPIIIKPDNICQLVI